jgi:hypothetical protein
LRRQRTGPRQHLTTTFGVLLELPELLTVSKCGGLNCIFSQTEGRLARPAVRRGVETAVVAVPRLQHSRRRLWTAVPLGRLNAQCAVTKNPEPFRKELYCMVETVQSHASMVHPGRP